MLLFLHRDYNENEYLDNYEEDGIDDREVEPMTMDERLSAEMAMRRRDMYEYASLCTKQAFVSAFHFILSNNQSSN